MRHRPTEFLGVDVGGSKVGIARGSALAKIAQPLKTVSAKEALDELLVLVSESNANGIVVGLPRGLDGQETPQTREVRRWVQQAKAMIGLPFFWQDEALTSKKAERLKLKADEHSLAASIILQDFLDSVEDDRVEI